MTREKAGSVRLLPDADDPRTRRPVLTDLGYWDLEPALPFWRAGHAAFQAELLGLNASDLAQILGHLT